MKHHCTVYRKDTGEIVQYSNFTCQEDIEQIARNHHGRLLFFGVENHDYVDAESDPERHYVAVMDGKAVVAERPGLVIFTQDDRTTLQADGVDAITLTGLPNPCEIIVDDPDPSVETQTFTVEGGGFVFSADDPGVYTVEVRRWPFLPFKIEFTAL